MDAAFQDQNVFAGSFVDFLQDPDVQIQEVNTDDFCEGELAQYMDDFERNQLTNLENVQPKQTTQADPKQKKTSRHVHRTASELDDIQRENHTDKTHRQTKWAVRIFRGNFHSFFLLIMQNKYQEINV